MVVKRVFLWLLVVLGSVALPAMAEDEVYRYRDDSGKIVLDDRIPSKYIPRGYEILSRDGRVIEQVAPIGDKASRNVEQQAAKDAVLMKRYGHPRDIQRTKQRQLDEIDKIIHSREVHIELLIQQNERLESRAAELEQQGLPGVAEISAEIAENREVIPRLQNEIEVNNALKKELTKQYDAEYERLRYLMNL